MAACRMLQLDCQQVENLAHKETVAESIDGGDTLDKIWKQNLINYWKRGYIWWHEM